MPEQERVDWKGRKVGDRVTDESGVNPYTITKLYGRGGKIQVGADGNVRVYWGAPTEADADRVIPHYRPNGCPDIQLVVNQQQRVLSEIFGTQVLLAQAKQLPSEGVEKPPVSTKGSLAVSTQELRSLLIPGRQDYLRTVVGRLEEVTRLLTNLDYPAQVAWVAGSLQEVLEGKLGRSTNRLLREATQILSIAQEDLTEKSLTPFARRLLRAVTEAQRPILAKALENASIAASISERLAEMQFDMARWREQITMVGPRGLAERTAAVVLQLEQALMSSQLTEITATALMADITKADIGIKAILEQMVANPDQERASKIRANLTMAEEAIHQGNNASAVNILKEQVKGLNNWRLYSAFAPNRFDLPADRLVQPYL